MAKGDPKQEDTQPSAPALLSVAKLAEKYGHADQMRVDGDTPFSVPHLMADSLNGWTRHKAYKSEDVTLSDADYLAAIEAAKTGLAFEPANKRPLTTFTPEQAKAKMESDLAATLQARKNPAPRQSYNPNIAHQLVMNKARALAQSSGAKLSKGGR